MPLPFAVLQGPALAAVAYVVDSVWEGIVIAALAALIIRLFRRTNATTRYAIWYIALLAVIVVPALTVAATLSAYAHACPYRFQIALPPAVTLAGAALWGLGVLAGLLRIVLGYVALARLQRDALPLPPGYRDAMPLWEESKERGRETRLCVSPNVAVPVAVGLFDGMILMPDHLLHSFDRADVDRFSLHEMAHLQRRDDWTCALERIACAVLFFNPAVRWIARQLDLEREVACDDWVVAQTREVRPYAVGLTKMAAATPWPHRAVPAPAIFASRKSISIRIERLLNKQRDVRPKLTRGPALACCAAILVGSAVLLSMAPVIGNVAAPAAPVAAKSVRPAFRHVARAASHRPNVAMAPRRAPAAVVLEPRVPIAAATAAPRIAAAPQPHPVQLVVVAPRHFAAAPRLPKTTIAMIPSADAPTIAPLARLRVAQVSPAQPPPASPSVRRADYLDALTSAGYDKLTADEIIALHDNGVSAGLIAASSRYFERRPAVRDMIVLSSSGVSASYLADLERHGVRTAPKEVITYLVNGVPPSYAGVALRTYPQLGTSSIVELVRNGVSAQLLSGLHERGYSPSVSELVELSMHGIPLSYIDAVNAHRSAKIKLTEIVKLHDHGVTGDAN